MQRNPVNAEWNEIAVMKLMYASLIRASQTWRGVTVTEFECKQLDTLRDEAERTVRTNATQLRFNPHPAHAFTAKMGLDHAYRPAWPRLHQAALITVPLRYAAISAQ